MHKNDRLAQANQFFHFGKSRNQEAGLPGETDGIGEASLEQAFDPLNEIVRHQNRTLQAAGKSLLA
jgi:hypothetical protein